MVWGVGLQGLALAWQVVLSEQLPAQGQLLLAWMAQPAAQVLQAGRLPQRLAA